MYRRLGYLFLTLFSSLLLSISVVIPIEVTGRTAAQFVAKKGRLCGFGGLAAEIFESAFYARLLSVLRFLLLFGLVLDTDQWTSYHFRHARRYCRFGRREEKRGEVGGEANAPWTDAATLAGTMREGRKGAWGRNRHGFLYSRKYVVDE